MLAGVSNKLQAGNTRLITVCTQNNLASRTTDCVSPYFSAYTLYQKKVYPQINCYNSAEKLQDLSEILHMRTLKHINKKFTYHFQKTQDNFNFINI